MVKLKVVTGYVPIPRHPRPSSWYGAHGEKFKELALVPVHPFYNRLEECWLKRFLDTLPFKVTHSEGDNPAKNTLAYHIVQHQKFNWLVHASFADPQPDVFVWMDYGIFGSIPGVTATVILDFLDRVRADDFAVPGCWPFRPDIPDEFPSWRFCGGLMIVPREYIQRLFHAVRYNTRGHIDLTRNVSWEVNTLARIERDADLPFRWYLADHDGSMFGNYK